MSALVIGCLIGSYLLGTFPAALLVSRWAGGVDPRVAGSGNAGAANVFRLVGPGPALLVALLDAGKGALGVAVTRSLDLAPFAAPAAGLAAMVGHAYPVWRGLRGGKAVATACGAFAVLTPAAAGLALLGFGVTAWTTGYASVASLVAAAAFPPLVFLLGGARELVVTAGLATALIVWRHRPNIRQLRSGGERRLWRADDSTRSTGEAGPSAAASPRDRHEPRRTTIRHRNR